MGIAKNYLVKIQKQLKLIYPKRREQEILQEYLSYKIMQAMLFLTAGIILAIVYFAMGKEEGTIRQLERQTYWGETQYREIQVQTPLIQETLEIGVTNQQMSEAQEEDYLRKIADQLPDMILGENTSLSEIRADLQFVSQIPNTQVDVFWEVEQNGALAEDGSLIEENLTKDGTKVHLRALLRGKKSSFEKTFDIIVFEPQWTKEERLKHNILKAIQEADEQTVSKGSLFLPQQVDGNEVIYRQPENEKNTGVIMIMFLSCVPLLFFSQDEKLGKRKQKREQQMMLDYPELVNKLTLYMGAGLTVRGAFEKISADYLSRKKNKKGLIRWGYEEIVFVCREMQAGMSEKQSLETMAEHCGIYMYRKLSALLLQNMKKGSKELAQLLQKEAMLAFEERKNAAKKMGEEAGTKLLFPMILMLGIVLAILIVPALMSFQI